MLKRLSATGLMGLAAIAMALTPVSAAPAAKKLFGGKKLPAVMKPAVHGFYSKGCLQGGVAIAEDGPTWQAMRLSRNRRWGHPELVELVMKLSQDATKVGWRGLLVGDISQPRGGPMLSGHASHQLGLDADIWLTEMPNRRLTRREREDLSATSMLVRNKHGQLDQTRISKRKFTKEHFGLIKTAAQYRKVQRILVHPTIKRELCRRETGDRRWLWKIRPYWGHHYHMHIRMHCPKGSPGCKAQQAVGRTDGCGKEIKDWFKILAPPRPPRKVTKKRKPRPVKRRAKREIVLAQLPQACRAVLKAPAPVTAEAATMVWENGNAFVPKIKETKASAAINEITGTATPLPTFRPQG